MPFWPLFSYPCAIAKHRGTKIESQQSFFVWCCLGGQAQGYENKGLAFLWIKLFWQLFYHICNYSIEFLITPLNRSNTDLKYGFYKNFTFIMHFLALKMHKVKRRRFGDTKLQAGTVPHTGQEFLMVYWDQLIW